MDQPLFVFLKILVDSSYPSSLGWQWRSPVIFWNKGKSSGLSILRGMVFKLCFYILVQALWASASPGPNQSFAGPSGNNRGLGGQISVLAPVGLLGAVWLWGSVSQHRLLQVALVVKNPPTKARDLRDTGAILGWKDRPGRGHGNPLQYSCLENPHGLRSLVGCGPWGRKVPDPIEWVSKAQ